MSAEESEHEAIIKDVDKLLRRNKKATIDEICTAVKTQIESSSRFECLTLIAVNDRGKSVRTLKPRATPDYVSALYKFCRKERWKGYQLDSALSEPASNIVASIFSNRVEGKSDKIIEKITPHIVNNDRFLNGISNALWDSYRGTIPSHVQSKITDALTVKLKAALSSQIDASTMASVKAAAIHAAGSISAPLAAKISVAILKTIGPTIKALIVSVLKSAAFKTAILAKVKAVVGAAVLGSLVHFLAAKLGFLGGATAMWILVPIFATWFGYEAYRLPKKLGSKVSESIKTDLEDGFPDLTRTISEKIVQFIMMKAVGEIADELINEDIIIDIMDEVITESS